MTPVGASAPGKALLCGEYAVLEGAPAVVSAIGRRVSVAWSDESVPMPPEVEATVRLAQAELGPVARTLIVDAAELQQDRIKLGLGSSAAAAAATAGAVFATHGHQLDDPVTLQRVFACALEGHASVAPQGSGVDVAASTFGGFLRFARNEDEVEIRQVDPPGDLEIRLVWTGHAARTSELVGKVRQLQRDDPGRYGSCIDRLSEVSRWFANAFEFGGTTEVVAQAASYAKAMEALGLAAGAPIFDARLRRAAELATRFSGSAKPCGAGGGDVAVAFFLDAEAAKGFEGACKDEGLHPIDVAWGASGVRAC
jgi:phosphomevalonate kinase